MGYHRSTPGAFSRHLLFGSSFLEIFFFESGRNRDSVSKPPPGKWTFCAFCALLALFRKSGQAGAYTGRDGTARQPHYRGSAESRAHGTVPASFRDCELGWRPQPAGARRSTKVVLVTSLPGWINVHLCDAPHHTRTTAYQPAAGLFTAAGVGIEKAPARPNKRSRTAVWMRPRASRR